MNKFTKLDDEIISVLGQDGALQEKGGLLAREVFALCQFAGDEEEVRVALNAMVKRGEIVRDKDKLYSFADKKAPDVVEESSETKKEEQVLTVDQAIQTVESLRNCILESLVATEEALLAVKRLAHSRQMQEALEIFRKAGNAPS